MLKAVPFELPPGPLDGFFTEAEWATWVEFVKKALDANTVAFQQARKRKRFLTPLWEFTRRIKAHARVGALSARDARTLVHLAFGEIFCQDKEVFLWEHHLPCETTRGEFYDPEQDFLNAWEKCSQVAEDPVQKALAKVRRNPPPDDAFGAPLMDDWRYREFLALAQELQEFQGDATILLPVEKLGRLLGVSQVMVSTWRRRAEEAGFLLKASEAVRRRQATEFYFQLPPHLSQKPTPARPPRRLPRGRPGPHFVNRRPHKAPRVPPVPRAPASAPRP